MNDLSPIGHNQGPAIDSIEACISEYDAVITEANNWADGELVADEAQMKAVDAVLKEFKSYKTALGRAGKERTDPLHKAWKAEVAAVKVYTDDADLIQKSLVSVVAPFKAKLAAQKEADRRAKWEAAEKARMDAEEKMRSANDADLSAQRDAFRAMESALAAEKAAQKSSRETVKGMREVTHYEVTSTSELLRWLNMNDRPVLDAFCEEYARKHHKDRIPRPGLRVWKTKEVF